MKDDKSYSIVIPVFNEAESIVETIAVIKALPGSFEIIVVDDGSTDTTGELAKKAGARVFRHPNNKGYGAALKTGIRKAEHDTIVITDGDGTYPNKDIPELVRSYHEEGYDMVVGARVKKNAQIPLIRKPAKWMIRKIASFLAKTKIPDLNSGLRVMKKEVVKKYFRLLPDGFSFTTTITLAMLTNNYNVRYIPVDYFRRSGKSKIRPIHDTYNFIRMIIMIILYFDPLRIFIPLSLPPIFAGLFLIIFQALYYHDISTASFMIHFAGVEMFAIGILADLIVKRTN